MELIIKIDDKDYEALNKVGHNGLDFNDNLEGRVYRAIASGTPLPKGHGRLIDADKEIKYARKWIEHPNQYISQRNKDFIYYLEKSETVIEADESEAENED